MSCILFSKFLIAPLVVTNWRSLSWKSRPCEQFKNKKLFNGSVKILRVDLSKTKNNIKNKVEGYPRVERGNISPFSFYKQFWNIPTPLWFLRNPLRELQGQTSELYLKLVGASTNTKENSDLAKIRFVWTIRFSEQLLAGSLVEIWQLIRRQQTTNHKYCLSTNQRKKLESGFWTYDPTSKCICPPSPCLNTGKEGMIAG